MSLLRAFFASSKAYLPGREIKTKLESGAYLTAAS